MEKRFLPPLDNASEMIRELAIRMGASAEAAELCARLIRHQQEKNVCLPLSPEECKILQGFAAVSTAPDESGPFILDGAFLYTRRYWKYEKSVLENIRRLLAPGKSALPSPEGLPLADHQILPFQIIASAPFALLTGGPGTGKTHTIAAAVKWYCARHPDCRLGIAAPTGKATARLKSAMGAALNGMPVRCDTIHAMLEPRGDGVTVERNRKNPLALDWLIVDEASMIDLPLMVKLLEAVPERCRLTLTGDAHQLSSVEPGRVFGDLCRHTEIPRGELEVSFRFPPGGEIDTISRWINSAAPEAPDKVVDQLQHTGNDSLIRWIDLARFSGKSPAQWDGFSACIKEHFHRFWEAQTPEEALAQLGDCCLLCPTRHGPCGTEMMNRFLASLAGPHAPVPVMITANDRELSLANGDVGVVMPRTDELCLPGNDGSLRHIPLKLLPCREAAFALTVHKAQGSEYRNVILLLPPAASWQNEEHTRALLTREILYTAVTRTKDRITLYADETTIRRCCAFATRRDSGLSRS